MNPPPITRTEPYILRLVSSVATIEENSLIRLVGTNETVNRIRTLNLGISKFVMLVLIVF